jgi:hypothetical protein
VSAATVDTLFDEDWSGGLDTTRWIPFGFPRSIVVHGAEPDDRSVFLNNGDYNHGSGAVSVQTFEVGDAGLTLEAEAWLPFTGQHWQIWQIGLSAGPFVGPEVYAGPPSISSNGPEPTWRNSRWMCADGRPSEEVPIRVVHWRRVAVVVRPDAVVECWVDGRMLGAASVPDTLVTQPLAIVLRGHSVGTRLYHGRVVVTRGMRY